MSVLATVEEYHPTVKIKLLFFKLLCSSAALYVCIF